jgi:hypothetical protein
MRYLKLKPIKEKMKEWDRQITPDGLHAIDVKMDDFLNKLGSQHNGGHKRLDAKFIQLFKM